MLETIKNYKIISEGQEVMTQETQIEMEIFFRFLLIFSLHCCDFLKDSNTVFLKALNLWLIKMREAGWTTKEINKLCTKFLRTKWHYRIEYPEKDSRGKPTRSLQTFQDWGDGAIVGSDLKVDTIKNEEDKLLETLTETQFYYFQLFNSGKSVKDIAVICKTSEDNVRAMRRKLRDLLKDLMEGEN